LPIPHWAVTLRETPGGDARVVEVRWRT
jgi:hypothetical protein